MLHNSIHVTEKLRARNRNSQASVIRDPYRFTRSLKKQLNQAADKDLNI